jgi:succinylarginine dihydrolase
MSALEFNFDSLVGPTHNYAGLAHGNLASQQNQKRTSYPRRAALEGLAKMKFLADLGIPQAVLPPHHRPHIPALRQVGFVGTDAQIVEKAAKNAPELLAACSSASAMWAANAATISPSADTHDNRVHITPANLTSHLHRSLETPFTTKVLRAIFEGEPFVHHDPLPSTPAFFDEGAANHSRLCPTHGAAALELFTHGQSARVDARFNPRQSPRTSEAIARLHQLGPARTFFLEQSPEAIDAGVFHNDVIAVANEHILLHHENAYTNLDAHLPIIHAAFNEISTIPLKIITIPAKLLPLQDAVASYLFNSQFLTLPDKTQLLLAPEEVETLPTARAAIRFLQDQLEIKIQTINVRESMQNGGGPACLRLRVVLTQLQQEAMHQGIILTESLQARLIQWIEKNYREELTPKDLADPRLLQESQTALDELSKILNLPRLYPFQ